MRKIKKGYLILLVLVTVGLGFLRDHVFISINNTIETGNDSNGYFQILKWVLTGFFSILYLGITCAFLFLLFRSKKYTKIAAAVYVLIIALSFLIGGIGSLISSFEKVYPFVRNLLGIAQSPIVMMVLIPACYINEHKLFDKKG